MTLSRILDSGFTYILQDKTLFCAFEAGDHTPDTLGTLPDIAANARPLRA